MRHPLARMLFAHSALLRVRTRGFDSVRSASGPPTAPPVRDSRHCRHRHAQLL